MNRRLFSESVMRRSLVWLVLVFSVLLLSSTDGSAQQRSSGSVSGTVKDSAGSAINDADVALLNAQQAALSRARTDGNGQFKFTDIPVGSYVLVVSRSDFSVQREVVRVNAGQTTDVNISLQVNQITDSDFARYGTARGSERDQDSTLESAMLNRVNRGDTQPKG